jgi:predicted AAA+ superfamily ATPase
MGVLKSAVSPATYGFGHAFEHLVFLELYRRSSYLTADYRFSYLMTKNNLEIDFVVERPGLKTALVEVKSTDSVQREHLKSLLTLGAELPDSERFCLSNDTSARIVEGVNVLHWKHGLEELGLGIECTDTT